MKTILLPTDFTKHSEKAMQFAIRIAQKSNAKIIVTNCFFVPNLDINTPVDILEDIYILQRERSEKLLMECCQKISLHKNDKGESVPTEFISEQNIPSSQILKLLEEKNVDLIIMGVEDQKRMFDLLGSTALHVSKTARCPVLLIHEKSEYHDFDRVYFAIENIKEDLQKIKKVIPLARIYDSEISILHIDPLPQNIDALEEMLFQKSQYDTLLIQISRNEDYYPNIHFHYNISNETFKKMDQLLQSEFPDLLVLVHKDRSLLKSVFHKSTIKRILKTTNTPLLILH